MTKFISGLIGFILGVITVFVVQAINKPSLFENIMTKIKQEENLYAKTASNTFFDIKTKNGTVTLHLRMPKDSVFMLVGKPDEFSSDDYGFTVVEKAGYHIKNKYSTDLDLEFENGKLKSVRQD